MDDWNKESIAQFVREHDARLLECGYPPMIIWELQDTKNEWICKSAKFVKKKA